MKYFENTEIILDIRRDAGGELSVSTMFSITSDGTHTGVNTPTTIRRVFKLFKEKLLQDWISYFHSIYSKTHLVVLVILFTLTWLPWVLTFFSDLLYHAQDTDNYHEVLHSMDTPEFNHWINRSAYITRRAQVLSF